MLWSIQRWVLQMTRLAIDGFTWKCTRVLLPGYVVILMPRHGCVTPAYGVCTLPGGHCGCCTGQP